MSAAVEEILRQVSRLTPKERHSLTLLLPYAVEDHSDEYEEERRRIVLSLRGKYAHLPGSLDEFLARKAEDLELEEYRPYEAS